MNKTDKGFTSKISIYEDLLAVDVVFSNENTNSWMIGSLGDYCFMKRTH